MVVIYNVQHHYEAGMIIELLGNEGIKAIVDEKSVDVMDIITGLSIDGYDILVDEENAEKAIGLIEAYMEEKDE